MTTILKEIADWVESDHGSCPVSGTALLAFLDSQQAEIDRLRAELAKPVEQSYTATQLAAMVLSDCGISTNHTALHERVAERITRHEDQLIDSLQKLPKPVTDVVVTKNKSGQIVAVTLQDEDGRAVEVVDESTPAPAWHDAPTEPGLWFNSINHYADIVSQHWIDRGVVANSHARWYGPIPEDKQS